MERIAVFRALQLGDLICSMPALRALREWRPSASIVLIGLPWASTFVSRFSSVFDGFIAFPGAVGFPEQEETDDGLPAFYTAARAWQFDLAIQLHGSGGIANDIVHSLGARECAGFVQPGERRGTGTFVPWPDHLPEPERYNVLMRALGAPVDDAALWFPLTPADELEADWLVRAHRIDTGRAVIVHPGAQWASRRWPAERFATVADDLAASGAQILLTGTNGETALAANVARCMRHAPIQLVGQTSLGALAALVARARLVVCNDTGISHIAAALGTRSVVVASGSDTARWAPADRIRHRVLAHYPPCRPCAHPRCPYGHECALGIDAPLVVSAALHQLDATARESVRTAP